MLVVPADNPLGIHLPEGAGIPSLTEILDHDVTMAVCAPEVPCGAAAAKILESRRASPPCPDTYEEDVRAALTKVELGEVDAGAGLRLRRPEPRGDDVEGIAFPEAEDAINDYPICVLDRRARTPTAAQAFVDLVLSDEGQQALGDAGLPRTP